MPTSSSSGPLRDFLEGEPLFNTRTSKTNAPEKSRVRLAQYHAEAESLMLEYEGGSAYLYSPVSEADAIGFFQADSWGEWCWDHLRVRGSKTAHQVSVKKLR